MTDFWRNRRVLVTGGTGFLGHHLIQQLLTASAVVRSFALPAHAKRTAEKIAIKAAIAGRDIVVVNPGYLVGPEDFEPSVMGKYCARVWKCKVTACTPGGFNLVDVRDVAAGHMLAAERGQTGRRYI